MISSAVRASGTEDRRSGRDLRLRFDAEVHAEDLFPDHVGAVLALDREALLADAGDAPGSYLLFYYRFQFFENIELVYLGREVFNELFRKRVAHTQFEDRRVRAYFFDILVSDALSDETDLLAVQGHISHLYGVERSGVRVFRQILHALFDYQVALFCHSGHHDVFLDISLVGLVLDLLAVAELYFALGMSQAGRGPYDHRRIELLADLISVFDIILGFLGISRFHAGDRRRAADHSCVLLVLGAVQSGVIRDDCHHTAVASDIGEGIQGIRRHIETHHFHGAERPDAADGSADRDLRGHFLIGSPLRVNAGILHQFLADLCAGRSGIGGRDFAAGFPHASGNRSIAEHHFLLTHFRYLSVFIRRIWLSLSQGRRRRLLRTTSPRALPRS